MRALRLIAFCIAVSAPGSASIAGNCLKYEPEDLKLVGMIETKVFPGPPKYESVERGDYPETAWLLQLAQPVCIAEGNLRDQQVSEPSVTTVQLSLRGDQFAQAARLIGTKVEVRGSLFHKSAGHHHAPVLFNVKEIKKQ
jgi:hypothetical protein